MSMPDDIAPEEDREEFDQRLEERDIEAPIADALEQATPADPSQYRPEVRRGLRVNDNVNEYDALEQARIVELDDDYRP